MTAEGNPKVRKKAANIAAKRPSCSVHFERANCQATAATGDHIGGSGEAAARASGAGAPQQIYPGNKGRFIEPDVAIEDFAARDLNRRGEREIVVGPQDVRVAEARAGDDYGDQEEGYNAAAHSSEYSGSRCGWRMRRKCLIK